MAKVGRVIDRGRSGIEAPYKRYAALHGRGLFRRPRSVPGKPSIASRPLSGTQLRCKAMRVVGKRRRSA